MSRTTTEREFALPDLGEGLTEAELVSWEVAVGDVVALNQVVAEVETAKALVQLPSPWAGTVARLCVEEGATVRVGTPILAVEVEAPVQAVATTGDRAGTGQAASVRPAPGEAAAVERAPDEAKPSGQAARTSVLVGYGPPVEGGARPRRRARSASWTSRHDTARTAPRPRADGGAPAVAPAGRAPDAPRAERPRTYPPVRRLAHELGVDLTGVTGTGPDGLVTRDDVLAAAGGTAPTPAAAAAAVATHPSAPAGSPREVRTPIAGVRRQTAAAMVASAFTAPHATEFLTVDVTPSVELLADLAADRRFADHRVTVLALVAKAMTVALRRHPTLNAHWDEAAGEIVQYGYVNLGVAAATPRGLLVPVVRDAEHLDLVGLADALAALTQAARAGTTPPADLVGGTITVTNIGVFGVDAGTPILVPGQAAILATGAVRRMPWEHDGGIALRSVMTLSLSFDHRLVDGEQASRFLADVGEVLARPAMVLTMV